jgi:hypothetical protein
MIDVTGVMATSGRNGLKGQVAIAVSYPLVCIQQLIPVSSVRDLRGI